MTLTETLFVLAALVLLNAFLALSELAIASAKRLKLKQWADGGNVRAGVVLHLKDNPNHFLGIVQIGLNVVGILAGVFGEAPLGALAQDVLGAAGVPDGALRDGLAFVVAIALITATFLLFGDLLPKRVALYSPERLACALAPTLQRMQIPFTPLLWFFGRIVDGLLGLVGIRPRGDEQVTTDDIYAVVDAGAESGAVRRDEHHLIGNVLSLGERSITSAMTPRHEIVSIDIGDTEQAIKTVIAERPKARFVITDGDIDHPIGYIDAADILARAIAGEAIALKRDRLVAIGMKPVILMPDTVTVLDTLDRFRVAGEDIALVANEYAVVVGLITMSDVMSAIMGRIVEEVAREPSIVKMKDREGAWLIDGRAAIGDVKALFEWDELPGEESYETISGFIMSLLRKWPAKADSVVWQGVKFVVVDTEGSRIDQVMASIG